MNPYRMSVRRLLFLGFASLAASFWVHIENLMKVAQRMHAAKMARTYTAKVGKPLLNYGCEDTSFGDLNVDIEEQDIPNFMLIEPSPAPLPFPSKSFGAVVCCHVMEHVPDPWKLDEDLRRVADRVFYVNPPPIFLWTWLWPDHKWVFIRGKARKLK